MAIITISRQIASFGDEVATELSKKLGYSFINRKLLEDDLLKHGLTEDKLLKYDERKPGFWASLARDRDEYFDYLREAVYERARNGNCVFIGRGGFAILKDVPGCYSVRLIASDAIRTSRLMKEFSWPEKKAQALMAESDNNRRGFHKCFFNSDQEDPSSYNLVINTDGITPEIGASIIEKACAITLDASREAEGLTRIGELLQAQKIVNHIVFDLKIPVHFLEATASPTEIMLHGVADSSAVIEKVLGVARSMAPGKKVSSGISIVQDYKSYP
jgi:Cytidylate kinase